MNQQLWFSQHKNKGFTLIEFVVASALGLLLTLAVGSLYFYTSRLNHIAEIRLKTQEDLKRSAALITQDAHLAGNFGCLSLGSLYQVDSRNTDDKFSREFHVFFHSNIDKNSPIVFDKPANSAQTPNQNFGVNWIDAAKLQTQGNFVSKEGSKALIFYYGRGSSGIKNIEYGSNGNKIESIAFSDGDVNQTLVATAENGGYLALASCQALNIFKSNMNNSELNFSAAEIGDVRISYQDETNKQKISEVALFRYIVNAYVVGTLDTQQGLFRIELSETGEWGYPVLIAEYVTDMQASFFYPTSFDNAGNPIGCPSAYGDGTFKENNSAKFNDYSFVELDNATYTVTTDPTNSKVEQGIDLTQVLADNVDYRPPTGIAIILNLQYPEVISPFKTSDTENININFDSGEAEVNKSFRIFSSIRGGNQCANRKLLD